MGPLLDLYSQVKWTFPEQKSLKAKITDKTIINCGGDEHIRAVRIQVRGQVCLNRKYDFNHFH